MHWSYICIGIYTVTQGHAHKLFMPTPPGAGGIMFSVCPSVLSPVSPCDHYPGDRPTHLLSVHPSVRPERFPRIFRCTHRRNGLKCCMLMHTDYFRDWEVFGHSLLIFLIFAQFWLSETSQIWRLFAWFWRTHRRSGLKFGMMLCPD